MKKRCLCLLLSVLLLVLTGCQKKNVPDLMDPVGVRMDTAKVVRGDIFGTSVYHGEVVPLTEVQFFAEEGILGEILVKTGDTVKKGALLARLNVEKIREQAAALEQEIGKMTETGEFSDRIAQAKIAIAKEELAVLREQAEVSAEACAAKQLSIEKMQLDLQQAQELRALDLEYKRTRLAAIRAKMANTELYASVGGRVTYVTPKKVGERLEARAAVVNIAVEEKLQISSEYIAEAYIDRADKVVARVGSGEVEVQYHPFSQETYVEFALSGKQPKSTFSFLEEVEATAGQYAAVLLISSYKEDVLTVPSNAVYRDGERDYVYKIEGESRVRCDVTVGVSTENKMEIIAGLKEGDEVYVKE